MRPSCKRCVACNRVTEESSKIPFCSLHVRAYENLIVGYVDWRNAYGDLSPKEFLERVRDNEYSGRWVREVAGAVLSHEDLMQIFLNDLSSRGMKD
ncbi:MAG: hypothetical protein FGF52_01670 [Candidatus Brockarchaeota archaeon]|nr:hypothetical protein [Candidatus Brockarchaeota archaeon]